MSIKAAPGEPVACGLRIASDPNGSFSAGSLTNCPNLHSIPRCSKQAIKGYGFQPINFSLRFD